jgi:hypothetical protein
MARRWQMVTGVMALVLALAGVTMAAPSDKVLRPIRVVQDVPEIGLSTGVTMESDGGLAVTATAGDLTVRKQVYADGRFVVRVATQGEDRLLISGAPNGLKVAYGAAAAVELSAERDLEYEGKARRVRGWLAQSNAVQRFRHINEVLEQQDALAPELLSLRVTGALVAELLGDPGAARRLSRSMTGRLPHRLRKVQNGYTSSSCWDTYQRLVVAAAASLESCINSFAVYNPLRQVCAFIWTLQVESAWFQFLSCSSIPMK